MAQKSAEWFALRSRHFLTASHAQAIGNGGKGLETLVWEKLAERYAGSGESYTNSDIERGNEFEAEARALYEASTFQSVREVGFVTNHAISILAGASPDGLIGTDGLLEIKCPNATKFFRHSIRPTIEPQYAWQMQMQLLVTERAWVDYVLFNPHFEQPVLIERVFPDAEKQEKLVRGLKKGEELTEEIIEQYELRNTQNEKIQYYRAKKIYAERGGENSVE